MHPDYHSSALIPGRPSTRVARLSHQVRATLGRWAVLFTAACLASGLQAASVGAGGYTNDFSLLPAAADWSTYSIPGASANLTTADQLDGAVQAIDASAINTQVVSTNTDPPALYGLATWSSTGLYLQTRPTGNNATLLMCTLTNALGVDASSVSFGYDFAKVAAVAEEVEGHRVYYSLTGAANSWTVIPALCSAAPGRLTANLSISWPNGSTLYLLWADDNGSPSPDTACQVDNFSVTATPATQVPVAISDQPQNQTVVELQPVTFTVGASGNPAPTFQWYTNDMLLPGATNASFSIPSVLLALDGVGFQVVAANVASNVSYVVTSSVATLTVRPDTNPPVLLGAQALGLSQVLATFSERISLATATNLANYAITSAIGGSLTLSNALLDASQTNVLLTVSPLTEGLSYTLVVNGLTDLSAAANLIAPNSHALFSALSYVPQDIGAPPIPGSAMAVPGGLDVTASGRDVGGTADQFFFNYQPRTGDFDVKVRVATVSLSDVWAKAGLMARETLQTNSRFAAILATPSVAGTLFEYRSAVGGAVTKAGAFPVNFPYTWLRLQRAGNLFTGYASWEATTWRPLGSASLALPATIYVGMAASSHSTNQTTTVQFRDLANAIGGTIGPAVFPREPLGPSSRKTGLAITEIMSNPPTQPGYSNSTEFIELYNSNPYWEDISGYRIAGSVDYTFPANTIMQAGAFLVVARNPAVLQSVSGLQNVLGPWLGAETNGLPPHAGTVRLRNQIDAIYLQINYSDSPPWPAGADGTGHSIVLARPSYGEGDPKAWDLSDTVGGSPGRSDPWSGGPLRHVVINEFLAHSDNNLTDFIELYNHANQLVDISGCTLSDEPGTNKFVIPAGTILPPRGFAVFYQPPPGQAAGPTNLPFGLNSGGETIYFKNPDGTQMLDVVKFGAQALGRSTGRSPDGAVQFYPLQARTPGTNNSGIFVHDIVINEIMYDPISGSKDDQYVELYNKGTNAISLAGWRFVAGIDYTFSDTAVLAPDGYLVVARNAARLLSNYPNLGPGNLVGDFQGSLAHGGEPLALAMPDISFTTNHHGQVQSNVVYVVMDEVTYGTGGQWPHWAHGGGSSLELIDPRANHRLPSNWADSDETAKAPWTMLEVTGPLANGSVTAGAVEGGLLEEGECLVDNVEVVPRVTGLNLVANSTFESGLTPWVGRGNHIRSSLEEGTGFGGGRSFHVRASSRCDYGPNRIYSVLTGVPTGTNTIRAKVRWLCGWPEFLLRLHGGWLEASGPLNLPPNLGTPGARNSRALPNASPAIYEVVHSPVLPDASQAVVVTARLHDPDGLSSVALKYRLDPASAYTTVPMVDDGTGGDDIAGDGIYSATIPGQASGTLVAFLVTATDRQGASSLFPTNTPVNTPNSYMRECLVRFGEPTPPSSFGTYRQWLTQTARNNWVNRPYLANEMIEGTFVYNSYRVIYNFGTRIAGSPWHQGGVGDINTTDYHYTLQMQPDDLLLGTDNFNKVHAPGNGAFDDSTLQREQTGYWIARQMNLPWTYRRFVNMYVNGNLRRANALMEDMQIPDPDLLDEYFPNDANGFLCKNQCWFEMDDASAGGMPDSANQAWCTLNKYTTTVGGIPNQHDRGRYRWNWFPRAAQNTANDYTNVFALIDAANTPAGPALTANLGALADLEEWFRVWAARHAIGDWDFYGSQNAQNAYSYKPTQGKWNVFMFDMNIILGNGSWGPGQALFPYGSPGGGYTPGSPPGDAVMPVLFSHPPFRRIYLRALKEICNGPMVASRVGPIMDAKYAAFQANDLNVTDPSGLKTWIDQARSSILGTVAAEDATVFSVAGTNFISTSLNLVTLTGSAPVQMASLTVNGEAYPLTWTGVTAWTLRIPLSAASNVFNLRGYDLYGRLVTNALATVTVVDTNPLPVLSPGSVVFNELMYHPLVPDAEYVELFNVTSSTLDLSSWRIEGLGYTFPPGSFVGPRAFVLLVKDPAAFFGAYGSAATIYDVFPGNLQANGETLTLIKPGATPDQDVIMDKVRYDAVAPWPTAADGTGSSLQLLDARQDNSRPGNWFSQYVPARYTDPIYIPGSTNSGWCFASTNAAMGTTARLLIYLGAPGSVYIDDLSLVIGTNAAVGSNYIRNGDFEGPLLEDPALTNSFFVPTNYTNTVISADIKHGGNSSLHIVADSTGTALGKIITQNLSPAPPTGTNCTLSYWYLVTTNATNLTIRVQSSGLTLNNNVRPLVIPPSYTPPQLISRATNYLSPGAANPVATNLPPIPPLWINEVQLENVSGLQDAAGHRPPWIELYNAGTNVVSLQGLYLADNFTNPAQWAFPAGASINPSEFKVVFADGMEAESTLAELHTSFALQPGSGSVALARLQNGSPAVLDYLSYSGVGPDRSFGSYPDGQLFFRQAFFHATPGAPNDASPAPLQVFINEWMASNTRTLQNTNNGGRYDDWFELYNAADTAANLAGCYLTDTLTNWSQFAVPSGFVIPPRGFLLVWADNTPGLNGSGSPDLHVSFRLDRAGEQIGLFASDGTPIDTVVFGQQTNDVSQGRYPDGAASIVFMPIPTPRLPNLVSLPPAAPQLGGVAVLTNSSIQFAFTVAVGTRYQVQSKDDFGQTDWSPLGPPQTAAAPEVIVTDDLAGRPQRFYRVVLLQ